MGYIAPGLAKGEGRTNAGVVGGGRLSRTAVTPVVYHNTESKCLAPPRVEDWNLFNPCRHVPSESGGERDRFEFTVRLSPHLRPVNYDIYFNYIPYSIFPASGKFGDEC